MVPSTYTESGQPRRGQISARGDQTTARGGQTSVNAIPSTSTGQPQSKAARAGSDNGIGLHTPDNTPTPSANQNESTSPPLHNRGR